MLAEHIIWDLDGTLIDTSYFGENHTGVRPALSPFPYQYTYIRPYAVSTLCWSFEAFETVSIWTAASREYALKMVGALLTDEQADQLAYLWSSEHCDDDPSSLLYDSRYKNLSRLFDEHPSANASNTVMIDDTPSMLRYHRGNHLIVSSWDIMHEGAMSDKALLYVRDRCRKWSGYVGDI